MYAYTRVWCIFFVIGCECHVTYYIVCIFVVVFFFFKQKTAYEMRISDWSSDVCSSDLLLLPCRVELRQIGRIGEEECRSSEFGKEHVEITLACNERLVLLGVTSAQRDADEVAHPIVEVCEERIGFGLEPIVAD